VRVSWPKVHKPQFYESTFAWRVLRVLSALTLLAWIAVLWPDEPSRLSAEPLTDAEVIELSVDRAVLRVSDPTAQEPCYISRAEFDGDLPELGEVIPVEYTGADCYLPLWTETAPSIAMRIGAIGGTLILFVWTVRAFTRPQTSRPQVPAAAPADRSRAKARRRRKRRLKR
jgi:hypothetical protein